MTGSKIFVLFFGIFLMLSLISGLNVCCEKTTEGAWCQNTLEENCDEQFKTTPTSCDATSYCKLGCCYNSQDGTCARNTPQNVCNEKGGVWDDSEFCDIPQCNKGCCVLGSGANYVTLTKCKKLSALYGLNTDFRTNVAGELECIDLAQSQDKGACVYQTEEYERSCNFGTRAECSQRDNGEFHKDYLCSAEELGTNCGRSTQTTCIDGEDGVYFLDTCGNPANIYDAKKIDDPAYWQKIVPKESACTLNSGNSKECGNCDFFYGSLCNPGDATYGDYVCKDLSCEVEINGEKFEKKNGESWCVYDGNVGEGADAVGSQHFRYICVNGVVTLDPCKDQRKEICIEEEIDTGGGVFKEAACRMNVNADCMYQTEEEDCLNTNRRLCYWLEGVYFPEAFLPDTQKNSEPQNFAPPNQNAIPSGSPVTGNAIAPITGRASDEGGVNQGVQLGGQGICLPAYPPGFLKEGAGEGYCAMGNSQCVVEYTKKIGKDKEADKNEYCLTSAYAKKMNEVCTSLGDCGLSVNYRGYNGDDDSISWTKDSVSILGDTIIKGIFNEMEEKAGV